MAPLPLYVDLLFGLCIVFTAWVLWKASAYSKTLLWTILAWLAIQSILSVSGFYRDTQSLPPRFALLLGPALLFILFLMTNKQAKSRIDAWDAQTLTYLNIVRIPVEMTLLLLYLNGYVPKLMTFEGRNLDILSGISALVVGYLFFGLKKMGTKSFLVWNLICLGLLLNIVFYGILSVPSPFQQFAFDQPNIGLTYFPFTLLPGFVAPMVLLSHLVLIRKAFKGKLLDSSS